MSDDLDDRDDVQRGLTRRELFQIGNVLAMPVLLGGVKATAEGIVEGPLRPGPEIYQSIGVEPIINCRGTFTIIGGSVERPEVRAAMDAASKYFVQMDELAAAVGQRLRSEERRVGKGWRSRWGGEQVKNEERIT